MKGGQTGNLTCLGTGTLLMTALIEILLVSKLLAKSTDCKRYMYIDTIHWRILQLLLTCINNANCLETHANLKIIAKVLFV